MKANDYTPFNYKNIRMPLSLRLKIFYVKKFRRKNKELQRKFMKEMGARRRFTEERSTIQWYPSVESSSCSSCGVCVDFCPRSVYEKDGKGRAVVVNPYECVLLCRGCVPKCPSGAISFPDPEDFKKYVYYE